MNKIVFTEEFCQPENLFPFTLTRQVQDLRVGILTIREKWEQLLNMPSFDKFEDDYKDLHRAVELHEAVKDSTIYLIHGNILPTPEIVAQVKKLAPGEFLSVPEKESIVYCFTANEVLDENKIKVGKAIEFKADLKELQFPWHIFQLNAWAIEQDYKLLTQNRQSANISNTNKLINEGSIFIEEGAIMEHCIINATDGPVYIGKNALVMEGSYLRGPIAIGEGATVKMGAKIYGATTVGPYCTVGGEIKNAVLLGYSNKAHDGYLGDSVIGEWCNLGAGTSNSNVKNNASDVYVWMPKGQMNVGLKCGVFMGDYSRTAINTSINTGTVIGVSCSVFGNGLTPKYIPCFSWGSAGIERYKYEKALADIANWKALKKEGLTDNEKIILKHIFGHY